MHRRSSPPRRLTPSHQGHGQPRLPVTAPAVSAFSLALGILASGLTVFGGDQPQFGNAWSRNMVSKERGLPESFDPATGRNVRWTAPLGTESYATAVVAGGRVYIGTNNGEPRDPRHQGDRGVLMCLDEKDGHLLWQLVVPKREEDIYMDWPKTGMSSPPTVEGNRVYTVNNRAEVMCLDARGLANGNDGPFQDEGRHMTFKGTNAPPVPMTPGPLDGDILWTVDMKAAVGIWPHDGAHSSILVHGNHLYVNTGTGVDNTHKVIRTPEAPSLIVVDKRTGEVLARDDEKIAPRIFHCTWSSPSIARLGGRDVILFAAGNGILYAFEPLHRGAKAGAGGPATLKKVWQCSFDTTAPTDDPHPYLQNKATGPSNIYGMLVVQDDRFYVAGGGDWFWGKNAAWLKCFRLAGSGDATASALVWEAPLGRHTMCTPTVHEGLVYASDSMRNLHCIDAASGKPVWTHELGGEIWASALVADGKVYIGTRRGDFWTFAAGREKKVLSRVELGAPISATAVAANGTLYISTMNKLFAAKVSAK